MSRALQPGLYTSIWDSAALSSNDYVTCADKKTSNQVRCHPALLPDKAHAMHIEHDNQRGGSARVLPDLLHHWPCRHLPIPALAQYGVTDLRDVVAPGTRRP